MTDLISSDFTFTQSNLQTFNYCRRRFYLRYIRKLIWPAQLVNDPQYAQDRDAGVRFHQIVHQHFLGLDAALLRKVAEADPDPRLSAWLADFLTSQMPLLDGELFPEALFNTSIANHPLGAKVDLLQIKAGVVKIFDWKTSRQLPNLAALKKQVRDLGGESEIGFAKTIESIRDVDPNTSGKVLVANPQWNFVVADMGQEHVIAEVPVIISSEGKYLASGIVKKVEKKVSLVEIVRGDVAGIPEGAQVFVNLTAKEKSTDNGEVN